MIGIQSLTNDNHMPKKYNAINVERLKQVYSYKDGSLIDQRENVPGKGKGGMRRNPNYLKGVGGKSGHHGYLIAFLDGKRFLVHRLIWAIHHGDPGPLEVDHKDRIRTNNWIDNLRALPPALNGRNLSLSSRSSTGYKGVSREGNRFKASICLNGRLYNLGRYATPEAAAEEYAKASKQLHGEYGCNG